MDSSIRFTGFIDESLLDKVNVEGKSMIQLECLFDTDIFSLLMKLGAEIRFNTIHDLYHVVNEASPSTVGACRRDSNGKPHFHMMPYDTDTNLGIIVDHDLAAITGVSGNLSVLTEVLSQYPVSETWTMCLEDVPVTFGKMPMAEALLYHIGLFNPKPRDVKCKASIKLPDGKTPWNELPSIQFYLNSAGYVATRFDSLPEQIKQCFYKEEN